MGVGGHHDTARIRRARPSRGITAPATLIEIGVLNTLGAVTFIWVAVGLIEIARALGVTARSTRCTV